MFEKTIHWQSDKSPEFLYTFYISIEATEDKEIKKRCQLKQSAFSSIRCCQSGNLVTQCFVSLHAHNSRRFHRTVSHAPYGHFFWRDISRGFSSTRRCHRVLSIEGETVPKLQVQRGDRCRPLLQEDYFFGQGWIKECTTEYTNYNIAVWIIP